LCCVVCWLTAINSDNNILTKLTRIEETSKTNEADKRALVQVLSG
jgi:hypothetical protein